MDAIRSHSIGQELAFHFDHVSCTEMPRDSADFSAAYSATHTETISFLNLAVHCDSIGAADKSINTAHINYLMSGTYCATHTSQINR
jgi:hypothetical protein